MKKKIVVIGGGLAGCLICNELSIVHDVTLLELGKRDSITYPHIDFLEKKFGAVKTFCNSQGGTTNLWDNGLIPIRSADVSSRSFGQVLKEARYYMDEAAANLFFRRKRYSVEFNTTLSEMAGIANSIGVFFDGVDCVLYPKKYRTLGVSRKVLAKYEVTDISFGRENGRITTVTYTSGESKNTISPDILIICAGALGTPLIVMKILSAGGHPTEQCGLGFADHPMGIVGKIKVKKEYRRRVRKLAYSDKGDYYCRTAVRLKSDCGRYACCAYFRPALTMQNRLPLHKYKSLLGNSSGFEQLKAGCSLKILHPDILAEVYSHLFGVQVNSRIFKLLLVFEQKRDKGRINYEDGVIKVTWRVTDEELFAYNRILQKLKNMLTPLSDEMIFQMPLTEDWLWSAAHHSGTISLGENGDTFVDKDLKLHSCDNVFVCDGSVIQEHSYANTGLTIGSLAMRLADRIRGE